MLYCNAWSDGYISIWNSLHGGTDQSQTQTQNKIKGKSNKFILA